MAAIAFIFSIILAICCISLSIIVVKQQIKIEKLKESLKNKELSASSSKKVFSGPLTGYRNRFY
jgi:uncharacterized membrane protein YciS (DUF1049 family)